MDHDLTTGLTTLHQRAVLAKAVIYVFIAASALAIAACIGVYSGALAPDLLDPEFDVASAAILLAQLAFLISAIFVGMWIHRAHANLFVAGLDGLEFTPGWSVGWFFVPIMSLFKPFQAMRELWNRSHSEDDGYASATPSELGVWWGTFLIGNFLGAFGGDEMFTAGSATLMTLAVSSVVDIVSAIFLIKIIDRVGAAQRSMMGIAETFA